MSRNRFRVEPCNTSEENDIDIETDSDLQDPVHDGEHSALPCCGQEMCLLPVDHIALSTVVATEDCVVGVLSRRSLAAIEVVDPRFVQTMRTNFAHQLLKSVQPSVPLLK